MNLTIFWRAWKFDFWPLLGVYPPGLALADYWSHLLGVYTPWLWGLPPLPCFGFTLLIGLNNEFDPVEIGFLASTWGLPGVYPPALLWVYPFDWAKPGAYPPDHTGFYPPNGLPPTFRGKGKPNNRFNNEFDHFLAGVEIGFLASTWGLPPWPGLGRLLESSTWGLPPLAWGLPP